MPLLALSQSGMLAADGKPLAFSFGDGVLSFTLPRLEVFAMVVVEPA